ncbi:MAG: glycosyltransferase family 4 protein [Proteobacteria bacterium]|nr:glycosyltransferase family 4 protein [Pseudomonadota bacterium]
MQKLKIAILSYRSAPFGGGQGIYIHDISRALSIMGHRIDVISGPPYPNLVDEINLIKLPGLDLFQTFSFKERLKIFYNIKNKKLVDFYEFISVLFGGFPEMRTFGYRANKFLKLSSHYDIIIDNQSLSYGILEIQKRFPLIEIIHHPISKDYKFEYETASSFLYKLSRHRWYSFLKMQKKVAKNINNIVTPSKNSKKDIVVDFGVNQKNINVINNGLDINIFIPYKNIKRDPFRLITTASADVALKGFDYSLRSLATLSKNFPEISLLVIGQLKKNGHTSRLIKELGIEDRVLFKTALTKEEIAKEYASSSVAIVSSLYEGFGYPVIEAMSCEIPLIATNTSSIPELVGDFATLIPPMNENELSEAIKKILNNYEKYKKIAESGRHHIIENFNWLKITQKYEDMIYKTIQDFNNANL